MSSESVISLQGLGKCYQIYDKPRDRLLQMLVRGRKQYFREFWALNHVDFEIKRGEVIGVIGRNGSGKSTLLQLVCGTLHPTIGQIKVQGRIAALLELGSGFNPEFTGRENVYLSAALSGMSQSEIQDRFEEIVDFSGIGDFIDQPVKTYSSGMYVRLAFSVATNVDPDILVIDEALSVGDGIFARKSFERIIAMKEAGKTILFCSHSLYQVEALCDYALWLNNGELRKAGPVSEVTSAYSSFLNSFYHDTGGDDKHPEDNSSCSTGDILSENDGGLVARLSHVELRVNEGNAVKVASVVNGKDLVHVEVDYLSDPSLPTPQVGILFCDEHDRVITSTSSLIDNVALERTEAGDGWCLVSFPLFPLLKGRYYLHVYLLCERGIHVYDSVVAAAEINVSQTHIEQGLVSIPHNWQAGRKENV